MAYADWTHTVVTSSGNYVTELTTGSSKIQGNSSLAYANTITFDANRPRVVSGWTAGVTSNNGLVQTLFRQPAGAIGSGAHTGGVVFCVMQGSISPANECYYLAWIGTTITLVRGNLATFAGTTAYTTTLASASSGAVDASDGQIYAIELKWQYDVPSNGMILIAGYDGPVASPNTYDYSTITKIITYTDSPALIDGVSAGVGWAFNGSNPAGAIQMVYDVTQIYYP